MPTPGVVATPPPPAPMAPPQPATIAPGRVFSTPVPVAPLAPPVAAPRPAAPAPVLKPTATPLPTEVVGATRISVPGGPAALAYVDATDELFVADRTGLVWSLHHAQPSLSRPLALAG